MKTTSKTTEEQLTKDEEAKTWEEVSAFDKEAGAELSDSALEGVAGGAFSNGKCPRCGSKNVHYASVGYGWVCYNCFKSQTSF